MSGSEAQTPWPAGLETALEGRYRLHDQIGAGGMALVFSADDLRHSRKVAIKMLLPELAASVGADRFLREIDVTAGLVHPNILPLLDSGDADGLLYYVMPFVDGDSLADRLEIEPQLPLDEAARIVAQVGGALAHAHAKGVIHRDIKPANILFVDGQAVVADFGIAKALTEAGGEELTQTGLLIGTPTYMSPEQADINALIDGRSDLYALGCVLYRMLVGEAPFTGSNPAAILARHAVDTVSPPSTVRSELPKALDRVLDKALAKSPADRFATTEVFIDALEKARTVDVREERARNRRRSMTLAASVVILAVSGLWYASVDRNEGQLSRIAVLPVDLAGGAEQAFLAEGVHSALINELGQIGVTVVGRTSVRRYADGSTSAREIAQQLSVDALVEATVIPSGETLSVLTSLVDGDSQEVLWSGSFDTKIENLVMAMRGAADSIAQAAGIEVDPTIRSSRSSGPVDAGAYEALLRGNALLGTLTPAGLDSAMAFFEEALGIEPEMAEAHAGIASVWGYRQQMGIVPPYIAAPEARLAAREAVRLDSLSAAAQANRAVIETWQEWDWASAEDAFRRTLEIDPGDARTRAFYGQFLGIVGRFEESRAQIDSALALDPLSPLVQGLRAADLMMIDQFDEAIEQATELLAVVPGHPLGSIVLRVIHDIRGEFDEAFAAARAETAARGDHELVEAMDRGWERGGYHAAMAEAAVVLEARSEMSYVAPSQIYELYFAADMGEEAIEWLERAFDRRDPQLPFLRVMAFIDPYRDDPRIERLVRRMQYPEVGGT